MLDIGTTWFNILVLFIWHKTETVVFSFYRHSRLSVFGGILLERMLLSLGKEVI